MSTKTLSKTDIRIATMAETLRESLPIESLGETTAAMLGAGKEYEHAASLLQSATESLNSRLRIGAPTVFAWNKGEHGVSFRRMRAEYGVTAPVSVLGRWSQIGAVIAGHPEATAGREAEVATLVKKIDNAAAVFTLAASSADPFRALLRLANEKEETRQAAAATGEESGEGTPDKGDGESAGTTDLLALFTSGIPSLRAGVDRLTSGEEIDATALAAAIKEIRGLLNDAARTVNERQATAAA